jgi:hypothetical protein
VRNLTVYVRLGRWESTGGGESGDEAGVALDECSRQRSEDLSGSGPLWSFIAAGNIAGNHRRAERGLIDSCQKSG